ncbi:hypothetical protein SAMN05421665_2310 [Yoonia rosea]|uniref:Uncharacterized protein n=1 Tax=Yoonia rosea TaxID=287098 RepID=A0A1R3X885_9RHOB|nr:hypothetical protein SAMN05421665_2310 [Yoonia rosea]
MARADQAAGAGTLVIEILRNPVAIRVVDRMDRLPRLRQPSDHLLAEGVVFILRLYHPVDRKGSLLKSAPEVKLDNFWRKPTKFPKHVGY